MNGNRSIIGLMLESNLEAGNQEIPVDRSLRKLAVLLKPVVQARKSA